MKNILTLTNEQAINLYNFLEKLKLPNAKSRNRWKFLDVIEKKVFAYEKSMNEIKKNTQKKQQELNNLLSSPGTTSQEKNTKGNEVNDFVDMANEEVEKLRDVTNTFEFTDREIFSEGKAFFESVKTEELEPSQTRIYKKIEDAFINVQSVDNNQPPKSN